MNRLVVHGGAGLKRWLMGNYRPSVKRWMAWFGVFAVCGMLGVVATFHVPALGPAIALVAVTAWAHAGVLGFGAVLQRSVRRSTPIILAAITFTTALAGGLARRTAPDNLNAAPATAAAIFFGLLAGWIVIRIAFRKRKTADAQPAAAHYISVADFHEKVRLGRLSGYWYFWGVALAFNLAVKFATSQLQTSSPPAAPFPPWLMLTLQVVLNAVFIGAFAILPVLDVKADSTRLRVRWLVADPVEIPVTSIAMAEAGRASLAELAPWMRNLTSGKRRVLNFFSRRIVRLTLTTGETVVVGTSQPDAIVAALGRPIK